MIKPHFYTVSVGVLHRPVGCSLTSINQMELQSRQQLIDLTIHFDHSDSCRSQTLINATRCWNITQLTHTHTHTDGIDHGCNLAMWAQITAKTPWHLVDMLKYSQFHTWQDKSSALALKAQLKHELACAVFGSAFMGSMKRHLQSSKMIDSSFWFHNKHIWSFARTVGLSNTG